MTGILDTPTGRLAERDRAVLHRAAVLLHTAGETSAARRLHALADAQGNDNGPAVPTARGVLSPAELRTVTAMARGGTRAQAGRRLHITEGTVAKQLQHARAKTGASSTVHLVAISIARGWIPVDVALLHPIGRRP